VSGYQSSKKSFLHGLKLHLLITQQGQSVEFFLSPGFRGTVDIAYTGYIIADVVNEADDQLSPLRKKDSTRLVPPWVHYLMSS
jgi:hypothetical protein